MRKDIFYEGKHEELAGLGAAELHKTNLERTRRSTVGPPSSNTAYAFVDSISLDP